MNTIDTLPDDATEARFEADAPVAVLPPPSPAEAMTQKLDESPIPLKFSELKKGIAKPKKKSGTDFDAELRGMLDEQVRSGLIFSYASGKKGEVRYWSKDEKHAIREEALNLAVALPTLAELSKKVVPVSKADAGFIETVLRDLIVEDKLFEHPPKKSGSPARFGTEKYRSPNDKPVVSEALRNAAATPQQIKDLVKAVVAATKADKAFVEAIVNEMIAEGRLHEHLKGKTQRYGNEPPKRIHPLEIAKNQKALEKLSKDARKLLDNSGAALDDLLQRLRSLLGVNVPLAESSTTRHAMPEPAKSAQSYPSVSASVSPEKIEELILKEVASAPVLSLADLRRSLPAECRGTEFDAAAIRLFDQEKVVLYQDANPYRFSDAERAEFVKDETGTLFTTISTRS